MHFVGKLSSARWVSAFVLVLSVLAVSMAGEFESSSIGNVVTPRLSMPEKAQKCVEPVDIMRRDHMRFLLQQRDATVHQGVRTTKYSLTGCINCHAQAGQDGEMVRSDSPEYFCTGCHIYAGVKIDCFECHSDKPADLAHRQPFDHDNRHDLARLKLTGVAASLTENSLTTSLQQVEMCDA